MTRKVSALNVCGGEILCIHAQSDNCYEALMYVYAVWGRSCQIAKH